jgi:hypothetical protein
MIYGRGDLKAHAHSWASELERYLQLELEVNAYIFFLEHKYKLNNKSPHYYELNRSITLCYTNPPFFSRFTDLLKLGDQRTTLLQPIAKRPP